MWIRGLYWTNLLRGAVWVHNISPPCPYPFPHLWNSRTILYLYCTRHPYSHAMCTRIVRSSNSTKGDVLYWYLFHSAQCGGVGWPGPFCCQEGLTCFVSNEWFHECYYSDGVCYSTLFLERKHLADHIYRTSRHKPLGLLVLALIIIEKQHRFEERFKASFEKRPRVI